jgi:hypothetical protein
MFGPMVLRHQEESVHERFFASKEYTWQKCFSTRLSKFQTLPELWQVVQDDPCSALQDVYLAKSHMPT